MKELKIKYTDFGGSFNPEKYWVTRVLQKNYRVTICNENPDLLFYSVYGENYKKETDCIKVYISGENVIPNFKECDYSITSSRLQLGGRNFFMPAAFDYVSKRNLNTKPLTQELARRKFCCFIYSHSNRGLGAISRTEFCKRLMQKYKHVDCPGKALHNVDPPEFEARNGDWHNGKMKFVSDYKFIIAWEKSDGNGYITEKLVDAYVCNVVPIYWGSTENLNPFPKESMICASDYATMDELIERIRQVDEDDELYMSILRANPLRNPEFMDLICRFKQAKQDYVLRLAECVLETQASRFEEYTKDELRKKDAIVNSRNEKLVSKGLIPIAPVSVTAREVYHDLLDNTKADELAVLSNQICDLQKTAIQNEQVNRDIMADKIGNEIKELKNQIRALQKVTNQNQEKIISFVGESIKRQTDVTISLAVEHMYRLKCIYYSAASRLCWGKLRTSLVEKKKTLRLFLRKIRDIKKI